MKKKERLFRQNGVLLLKQLIPCDQQDNAEPIMKVFSVEEMKLATKNFDKQRIAGQGGYGTVYKGILPDDQVVAIKRFKFLDESQIEQFINELAVLARIIHRNVVRLIGCCLEDEVPSLIYEFVSNVRYLSEFIVHT